jgi:hypothetical protein
MALQKNSEATADTSVNTLMSVLQLWISRTQDRQLDGGRRSNRTPWRYFRTYNQTWCLNGDTKRAAVIEFVRLMNQNAFQVNNILVPSLTRVSRNPCLRLYGKADASGWYCYKA